MQKNRTFVLSIAGFDPCGGAGILADIKTFEQIGVQGLGIITANTLQVENKVFSVDWLALETIIEQIEILLDFYNVAVIKIGIIPNVEYLNGMVSTIKIIRPEVKIVWDTVLKSSSGTTFFDEKEVPILRKTLENINLITPNFIEYEQLKKYHLFEPIPPCAILLKGGHRANCIGTDTLYTSTETIDIKGKTKVVYPKHGSGCVLSSAIAGHWALGNDLKTACVNAKKYVENYLASAEGLLGRHKGLNK